ncbi:MAG: glycine cleavage system protein H [Thiohalomonadales bacterium]
MAKVRGCEFPESLYYHIGHNVWLSFDDFFDENANNKHRAPSEVTVGMTSYACSLSGEIIALTTKKIGKYLKKDQSCATVESGKWVGPIKVPFEGEIIEVNLAAVNDPNLINQDPYGEGWVAKVKPLDWGASFNQLLTGEDAFVALESKMDQDGFGGC